MKTITGSGTTFTNAAVGDVVTIGVGGTFGDAIISGVTSNTYISIGSTQFLSGASIAGVAYTISQKPKYTLHDSHYRGSSSIRDADIFGIDPYEVGVASTTDKYAVAHAGWVGIHTYTDMHGNLRVKLEVLVAMSGISTGATSAGVYGDAADDAFGTDGDGTSVFTP